MLVGMVLLLRPILRLEPVAVGPGAAVPAGMLLERRPGQGHQKMVATVVPDGQPTELEMAGTIMVAVVLVGCERA